MALAERFFGVEHHVGFTRMTHEPGGPVQPEWFLFLSEPADREAD
jgi:hypothetical protein